jgi:hypothetical protein
LACVHGRRAFTAYSIDLFGTGITTDRITGCRAIGHPNRPWCGDTGIKERKPGKLREAGRKNHPTARSGARAVVLILRAG